VWAKGGRDQANRQERRESETKGERAGQTDLVALVLEGEGAHGAGGGLRGHQVVADVLRERLRHRLARA